MSEREPTPTPACSAAASRLLWLPLGCAWLLMLLTFSAPGRDGPNDVGGLDVIALAKVAARLGSIAALTLALCWLWDHPRRPVVLTCLAPFGLLLGWAFLSILWSPLKAISAGQALSLLVLVQLAAVVGICWSGPGDTERVVRHLSLGLLVVSVALVAVDVVHHDLSGLNRDEWLDDVSTGLVHPTSAGATASLGLVILLAAWQLWGWPWTRYLLVPGTLFHSALLVLASSRMAMVMAAAVLLVLMGGFSRRSLLLLGGLVASVAGAIYLALDPGLVLVEDALGGVFGRLTRGESSESLMSFTGRTDLWAAIWDSYQGSPLIGHGYFVTSKDGLLDVWSGPANRSAHNVFLQVLVTLGLIGFGLFLWAMASILVSATAGLRTAGSVERLGAFLLLMALWYLGWSQLCESFMGPIQPEAVVFYGVLGLALGQVGREAAA